MDRHGIYNCTSNVIEPSKLYMAPILCVLHIRVCMPRESAQLNGKLLK